MRQQVGAASDGSWRVPLAITLIVSGLLCLAHPLRWLDWLEAKLIDFRFVVRGARNPDEAIVIIEIGDTAIQLYPHLPGDPHLQAQLIRRLTAIGIAAIGLDIPELARPTFIGAGSGDKPLQELVTAIEECGRVILPIVWVPDHSQGNTAIPAPLMDSMLGRGGLAKPLELKKARPLHPPANLCVAAAGLGALNVYPERDWTVRQVPLVLETQGQLFPAFALEVPRVARHAPVSVRQHNGSTWVQLGERQLRTSSGGELFVNFVGSDEVFPRFAFEDIIRGNRVAPEIAAALHGKIVLVGSTAVALTSRLRTPFSPYMSGVELQANAVDTLISGRIITQPSSTHGVALTLIGAALAFAVSMRLRPRWALVAVTLMVAGAFGAASLAFFVGQCVPMAGALLALLFVSLTLVSRRAFHEYLVDRRIADRLDSRMEALARAGRLLSSGLNRKKLLMDIMRWVEEEIECEAASLVTRTEDGQRLRFEIALGPKGDRVKGLEMEIGQGIVGTVVATGEPLIVHSTAHDPRFAREIASAVGFPAESILCVPMTAGGRVIGALEVINKRDGSLFTENDAALLTVLAQHAGMFLETARLYEILEQRVDLANAELRVANQQLAAEKRKLETIVEHMADGIIAADEGGRVVLVNHAAQQMLGTTHEQLFGRLATEVLPYPELAQLFATEGTTLPAYHELTVGDPVQRIIRAQGALVMDEHGSAGRVVVMTDITDLRELDRTKTDMVSFVSHELKSPLAAIRGFAGLIRDRAREADQRTHAEVINRQVERMSRLIDDFLNITRIDMGRELEMHWERIDNVRSLVQEAVDFEASKTTQHSFEVMVPDELPPLWADPDKLYQILVNLINNAVKYSPEGGAVRVTVERCPDGQALHFSVADEGIGIQPENMKHLFERFRRVRDGFGERIEGTGLGLFLTRHLVQAHGGTIWAESTPQIGSIFHFVLPIERQATNEAGSENQPR
ncbi:MAG: CHASE2 domain-containing protein [Candidatus Zipacnadales bacterium]